VFYLPLSLTFIKLNLFRSVNIYLSLKTARVDWLYVAISWDQETDYAEGSNHILQSSNPPILQSVVLRVRSLCFTLVRNDRPTSVRVKTLVTPFHTHTNLNIDSFLFDAISVVVCWWTSASFMLVITRGPWCSSVPHVCKVGCHGRRLSKIPLVRGLLIGQTNCTCNETLTAWKKHLPAAQAVFNKGKYAVASKFSPRAGILG
jgi:hypothetical protein